MPHDRRTVAQQQLLLLLSRRRDGYTLADLATDVGMTAPAPESPIGTLVREDLGGHGAEGGLPARCAGDNCRLGPGAGAGVAALGFGRARRVEQAGRDWPAPAAVRGDQPYSS